MMFKCSTGVLSLPVSAFFNIIMLFILITLEELNLSIHLFVRVKLLIELSLTVVHIFGIVISKCSLRCFIRLF